MDLVTTFSRGLVTSLGNLVTIFREVSHDFPEVSHNFPHPELVAISTSKEVSRNLGGHYRNRGLRMILGEIFEKLEPRPQQKEISSWSPNEATQTPI